MTRDRVIFGIHSITPYNLADKLPYGILKVLGGGNLELTGESEDLYGGSSRYPYASESTQMSTQLTANVKSYPNFLMELFLGATVTAYTAAANGEVRDVENANGSSVKSATTGIASVTVKVGSSSDLKWGRYVVLATSADTVDVYAMTDIDFNRGTNKVFLDDSLKIASALSIVASTAVEVAGFGLEMTGGSGAIALVAGDTMVFDVYPPHKGISHIDVGSATSEFPAFGAFMLAAKRNTREIFQIEAFNCAGSGMPIPLQEKTYTISDLTVKLLRDETLDRVFRVSFIEEVS